MFEEENMNSKYLTDLLSVRENLDQGIWWQFSWTNCNKYAAWEIMSQFHAGKEDRLYSKKPSEYL